ncbi:MAG: heavy-metal-associated domain-containing protein [Austwickia sp.]|nr:heavy-metal-associated domain-containing protein [Actinomycetota bacterium]MCB1254647.1 heavy-metal-associated domain-containing protein [Austwickia sp.]MCO5310269.1 heavy-metal-associated domain-containing protein [Austwickia sp.]
MAISTLHVNGLTCGNCVKHLTEELTALPGVTGVAVSLVPDGTSTATVTSEEPLGSPAIAGAVDEAGYTLVSVS